MRISVQSREVGYDRVLEKEYEISVAGIAVKHILEADDDLGYVTIVPLDAYGRPFVDREGELGRRTIHGEVVITRRATA